MDKEKSELESESMGFKDKEKALYTLKFLEGRDVTYQFRAIQNYYIRAKKILKITKDEKKLKNIGEAMDVFSEWMRDYKDNDRGKTNWPYLSIETIEAFRPLAETYGISNDDFYTKYKKVNGYYKALRTTKTDDGTSTWDIERNERLKKLINKNEGNSIEWYETENADGKEYPSKDHVRLILLGFSPDPYKLRELGRKMAGDGSKSFANDEKMEVVEGGREKRGGKRRRVNSSSEETDESDEDEVEERAKKRSNGGHPESAKNEKKEEGSGLSFKDKDRALRSLERLEGRDVCYQYHALAGIIKSAERVITCTKDPIKIKNMKEAVEIFENWITDYNVNHRSKENFGYLGIDVVRAYQPLAAEYGIRIPEFVQAYESVDGDYKKLRKVAIPGDETTWDIERNNNLRPMVDAIKAKNILWFETDNGKLRGLPTKEHTECIMWGYSVEPTKLKRKIPLLNEKLNVAD